MCVVCVCVLLLTPWDLSPSVLPCKSFLKPVQMAVNLTRKWLSSDCVCNKVCWVYDSDVTCGLSKITFLSNRFSSAVISKPETKTSCHEKLIPIWMSLILCKGSPKNGYETLIPPLIQTFVTAYANWVFISTQFKTLESELLQICKGETELAKAACF